MFITTQLVYCDRLIDLLSTFRARNEAKTALVKPDPFCTIVRDKPELKAILKAIAKETQRVESELGVNSIESKAHLIISIKIVAKKENKIYSRLDVVNLCGSEQAGNTEHHTTQACTYKQFAVDSFNSLSFQLLTAAIGKKTQNKHYTYTLLEQTLKKTILPHARILFITGVQANPDTLIDTLPALKFTCRIRECACEKRYKTLDNEGEYTPIQDTEAEELKKSIQKEIEKIQTEMNKKSGLSQGKTKNWVMSRENKIDTLLKSIKSCMSTHNEEMNQILRIKYEELLDAREKLHQLRELAKQDLNIAVKSSNLKEKENNNQNLEGLDNKLEKLQMTVDNNVTSLASIHERVECLTQRGNEQKILFETKLSEKEILQSQIRDLQSKEKIMEKDIQLKEENLIKEEKLMEDMQKLFEREKSEINEKNQRALLEKDQAKRMLQENVNNLQDQIKAITEGKNKLIELEKEKMKEYESKVMCEKITLQNKINEQQISSTENEKAFLIKMKSNELMLKGEIKSLTLLLNKEKYLAESNNSKVQILSQEYNNMLSKVTKECSRSNEITQEVQSKLASANKRQEELQKQFQEKIKTLEREISQLKTEKETHENDMKAEEEKNKASVKALQEELNEKAKQISIIKVDFNETIQAKDQQSLELQGIIEVNQNTVKSEREKQEKIQEENVKLKAENIYLMNMTSQQKEEILKLKNDTTINEKDLNSFEKEYDRIMVELKNLKSAQTSWADKEIKYRKEKEDMQARIQDLESKNQEIKNKKRKYKRIIAEVLLI